MGFNKEALLEKSLRDAVWGEPVSTRVVWATLIFLADKKGVVRIRTQMLPFTANVTEQECKEAIIYLSSENNTSMHRATKGKLIEIVDNENEFFIQILVGVL